MDRFGGGCTCVNARAISSTVPTPVALSSAPLQMLSPSAAGAQTPR